MLLPVVFDQTNAIVAITTNKQDNLTEKVRLYSASNQFSTIFINAFYKIKNIPLSSIAMMARRKIRAKGDHT